jgi:hypothetical protein
MNGKFCGIIIVCMFCIGMLKFVHVVAGGGIGGGGKGWVKTLPWPFPG